MSKITHRKKTGGRQAGTANKTTIFMRTSVNEFLNHNWPKVQQSFNLLKPRDKLAFIEKMLQYTIPRLQNSTVEIDFDKLSDEQLQFIVDQLKIQSNE